MTAHFKCGEFEAESLAKPLDQSLDTYVIHTAKSLWTEISSPPYLTFAKNLQESRSEKLNFIL